MSCPAVSTCCEAPPVLGGTPPTASGPLSRRLGEYDSFARDLVARVESQIVGDHALGREWDVEGDPLASTLVGLWAYVAEIVAAYSELTAAEAYLSTAADWSDLRRLAALVGYRPRPPVAAQGWIRVVVDKGADAVLPVGTRVQAPGTAQRAAQTFEVAQDTQLRSDWNELTATWVPMPVLPTGRQVRFLGDPGFRTGDQVLFVEESGDESGPCGPQPDVGPLWDTASWVAFLDWLVCIAAARAEAQALALANVVQRTDELGTALVTFDRDLVGVLSSPTAAYAAYRVMDTAGEARRLSQVLRITETDVTPIDVGGAYAVGPAVDGAAGTLVLDAALEGLSRDQTVAIVDWASGGCDVRAVAAHTPVTWEVAPGTPARASQLRFDVAEPIATLSHPAGPLTAYVVDRRVIARHRVPRDARDRHDESAPAVPQPPSRAGAGRGPDGCRGGRHLGGAGLP